MLDFLGILVESFQNAFIVGGVAFGIYFLHKNKNMYFLLSLAVGGVLSAVAIELTEANLSAGFEPTLDAFLFNAVMFAVGGAFVTYLIFRIKKARPLMVGGVVCFLILVTTLLPPALNGELSQVNLRHTAAITFGLVFFITGITWHSRLDQSKISNTRLVLAWVAINFAFSISIWLVDYSGLL